MTFVKVHIILPEVFTFCLIFAGVKRLTFASKDAERKQLLRGTALDHLRDMQNAAIQKMPRYNRVGVYVVMSFIMIGHTT